MRTTVESASGLALDLMQPEAAHISLPDVVHALAMQPRLLGAVSQRYSIAQHLLLVYELMQSLQIPTWGGAYLHYLTSKSHVAFIGDIPGAVRGMLSLQAPMTKLLSRIHGCVAQHIQAVYNVPPGILIRERTSGITEWGATVPEFVLEVVDAYETYHLMQGGGWSLQPMDASKKLKMFAETAWNASKYRFSFDTPPKVLPEATVQSDLLKKIAFAASTLRKRS